MFILITYSIINISFYYYSLNLFIIILQIYFDRCFIKHNSNIWVLCIAEHNDYFYVNQFHVIKCRFNKSMPSVCIIYTIMYTNMLFKNMCYVP